MGYTRTKRRNDAKLGRKSARATDISTTAGVSISEEAAPGHLARRLRGYEAMSKGRHFNPLAFHRPGSLKK